MRIARHNKLANIFASEVPKSKFHIIQEPSFNTQGRVLCPDTIVYNDDKAEVLDFSIRFETRGDALSAAYSEKVRKYEVLSDEVKTLTGSAEVYFHGLIVGARGSWLPKNYSSI